MENNNVFISPLEINVLKAMYYDVYWNDSTDLHKIAAYLDDEYEYDCGEFLTKAGILNDLVNVISSIETTNKNLIKEVEDDYHEKGPKLSRFLI